MRRTKSRIMLKPAVAVVLLAAVSAFQAPAGDVEAKGGRVLYLGDGDLMGAARYLGGVMAHAGIAFDHVPSSTPLNPGMLDTAYGLIIISDYPARNIGDAAYTRMASLVRQGTGLLMVGGWTSFHGKSGEYQDTVIADLLPVECMRSDDRNDYCHGLVPVKNTDHVITAGLPFENPPVVCGYNAVRPKKDSTTILSLKRITFRDGRIGLDDAEIPLLVLGEYGKGRTAAFATDLAPHWIGGLVDWGEKRVPIHAPGGDAAEVSSHYVQLVANILKWLQP